LELGELDVGFFRTQNIIEDARESGDFSEQMFLQSAGIVLLINQGSGTFNPITEDVRFRRAVAASIDKEALSQRAYGGEMLIEDGFMHPDATWHTEGAPEITYDADLASSLVEELKAEGWDGNIRMICPDTVPDVPVAYEAALEAVGMNVDTQVMDTNTHIAAVAVNKDYDLACWGLAFSDSDIWRQLSFNFASDSPSNRIGYANPAFDAAIDELFAAPDDDARRAAILKMSELYVEDVPVAIAGAVELGLLTSERVTGIMPTQQAVFLLQDASIED
jgi:peptide/nickel transport system substrate-binding protein